MQIRSIRSKDIFFPALAAGRWPGLADTLLRSVTVTSQAAGDQVQHQEYQEPRSDYQKRVPDASIANAPFLSHT